MVLQQEQLVLLAVSQVFYAVSVLLTLWIIDRGRREYVPLLATIVAVGLIGFTSAGFVALPTAIAALFTFTLIATVYSTLSEPRKRQVRYAGMLLGLLAGFHEVPGIETVPLYSRWWEYGSKLLAFDFPIDKAYAGLLLGLIAAQFHPQKQEWRYLAILPVGLAALVLLALLLGHPLQPTLPKYAAAFLFVNLLEVCFAEEMFFRGALQRELMLYLAPIPAIAITALLFGVVHAGRGWEFVALASLSGLMHGFIYWRTGMLSLSVLSHFAVNCAWIMLFPSVG